MTDDELKGLFDALRQENAEAHALTRRHSEEMAVETRRHSEETAAETRRLFEVALEGNRHEIRLVAEKVQQLDEKLDRESADIRQEMRLGFAETQAMIKFSYSELDRRLRTMEETQRTLEEVLEDLQSRVERLEGSTH